MRLPSPAAIAASLVINAAGLVSIERAAVVQRASIAREESLGAIERLNRSSEPMNFEFIEAPPHPAKKKPVQTQKISDRDSNAQDMAPGEGPAGSGPKLNPGASDQLAQQQGTPGSVPSPASPEVSAVPPPAPPAAVSTGRDRITTQAVTRLPSMGAQMQGEASFEALGSDAGAYIRRIKERIWQAWFPYVMSNYPRDFKTADALVSFVLDPNGDLKSVRIIDSQGSALFAAFCVEAVQSSSPFGPPPKEALEMWGKDEIEVKFGFHYR